MTKKWYKERLMACVIIHLKLLMPDTSVTTCAQRKQVNPFSTDCKPVASCFHIPGGSATFATALSDCQTLPSCQLQHAAKTFEPSHGASCICIFGAVLN